MKVRDHRSLSELSAWERRRTSRPVEGNLPAEDRRSLRLADREGVSSAEPMTCSPAELAEADRLISDLAALVDAGLIVVEPHVLGPARYGIASPLGDAA